MPKVSIVIPVYNAEKSIERCLDSIIEQSFSDFELILVNDGSTDSSLKILEEYAEKDERIKFITQENAGPSTARNTGIDNATGKYVYFVDADDYIVKDAIERFYRAAISSGAELTVCGYYIIKDGNTKEFESYYEPGVYEESESREIALDLLNNHSYKYLRPYIWIRMVRRDVLENPRLRFTDGIRRSEDYLFTTELHFRISKLCLITDQYLYYYVDTENSITNAYVENYWQMAKRINETLLERLPEIEMIKERLHTVLIYRSLIALNNAALAEDKIIFDADAKDILEDEVLYHAIDSLSFGEGIKRFKAYYPLMRFRLKPLVKLRYYLKYRKNKS